MDRDIARLALPALGALAAEPIYLLVDTAIVGHLGTPQLAGLALASVLLSSAFWLFNFLAYGTTARVARMHGAGQLRQAGRIAAQALWLALVIGGVLMLVGSTIVQPMVVLMGGTGAVATNAETYLRISLLGLPFVMIALAGQGYLRGIQDMILPLKILVVANLVNIVLELVFVYGLNMGIAGSAWGTVLSQAGAAVAFTVALLRAPTESRRPQWVEMRRLLRLGGDLFVRTGALLLAFVVIVGLLARHGAAGVAAHQVLLQIFVFIALALDALAIAAQAMIGRQLGAGEREQAKALAKRLIQWGVTGGVAIAVALIAATAVIPLAFTDDVAVVSQIGRVWLLFALMQPANAVVFVLDGVLMGAGDTRYLMWSMLVASFVVCIPIATITIARGDGVLGVWLAMLALITVRLVTNVTRVASGRWAVVGVAGPRA